MRHTNEYVAVTKDEAQSRSKMGISLRIFLLDEDDSLRRLPATRYERLLRREPGESLPEHAGKRLRYAEVAVELQNRKPIAIWRIAYCILHLDSEGRVDAEEQEKEMRLGMETLFPSLSDGPSDKVINAEPLFAKKRIDDRYRWKPTPEIEMSILEAVFGPEAR
jgi:hypothetical protein